MVGAQYRTYGAALGFPPSVTPQRPISHDASFTNSTAKPWPTTMARCDSTKPCLDRLIQLFSGLCSLLQYGNSGGPLVNLVSCPSPPPTHLLPRLQLCLHTMTIPPRFSAAWFVTLTPWFLRPKGCRSPCGHVPLIPTPLLA